MGDLLENTKEANFMNEFIDVAVPVGVRKTFTYSVPREFRERIAPGMRVLVPFGRKLITGYVVGTPDSSSLETVKLRNVKDLLEPEPAITPLLVETALWVADHYFAPPGEVFRALFPAGTQILGERKASLTQKAADLMRGGLRPMGLRPQEHTLLDILAQEDFLTDKELAERSGIYNAKRWIESLAAAQWIRLETFMEPPRVKGKKQLGIRLLCKDPEMFKELPPAQKRLCSVLHPGSAIWNLNEALKSSQSTYGAAKSLEKKGFVEIAPIKIDRVPMDLATCEGEAFMRHEEALLDLTPAQRELVDRILQLFSKRKAARCLIYGVTGSGKTEVYLRLISEVLTQGGTALFLVPEIGLTPLLSRLVVSRFPGLVSLLHSGMSPGERLDQWNRIRMGFSRVVVGTRSAVFAPLGELRLIIIDEEQDASYKQDESPCYHAREVAWQRIRQADGVLVMGSATPSIETFYLAAQKKEIHYFCLPERVESRSMPQVTIVDMSREFQRHGKNVVVSRTLQQELETCMRRGEQAIVLLNRRGYSRTLLCRSCGHVFICPDCSVSMTYHQQENRLKCHYCGKEREVPSTCEECGGSYIHYSGVGTEQLEKLLQSLLPAARIARLDRDTTRRRGSLRSTLLSFDAHRLDILVGTQMLAKGHDFPDVTLVGVVSADAGLSFPDFRSAERTFQLLIQVAGRAGRGVSPGRVVIQSYHPDNYAVRYAQKQDFPEFYRQEIDFRRLMGYPPFRNLIQILITGPDASKAMQTAEKIAAALKRTAEKVNRDVQPRILGPASAPMEKLRGNYRMQVLMKAPLESNAVEILRDCFEQLEHRKMSSRVHVDVDPLSLL
jgi:primosomal protein N' (replication factor Y)